MATSGLGISISESGIGSVLNRYQLRVPLNQRSYAWQVSHVRTLLTDFSNAVVQETDTYFLGTIVLTPNGGGALEVADGQQRLATTAILIATIRDHLYSGNVNERAAADKYTQNFLLEFDEHSSEHVAKLRLNTEDNDFFGKNILFPPDHELRGTAEKKSESHRLLAQAQKICRKHVVEIIAQYSKQDQAKRLYDWISFIRDSAIIIEIKVPDHFNAYTLFETLNDRGLRASQADIIKNYLFGKAQDRLSEVAPKWASMADIIESVDVDDLLLTYLRHYWISNNGPTVQKYLADNIRRTVNGRQQAVDLAFGLSAHSIDYAALFSPLEHTGWQAFDKQSRAYLYVITKILGIEQIRPLLLSVIIKFDPKEAKAAFKLFLSWSVRFLIAGGGGGGVLDRNYGLCAKEITTGEIKTTAEIAKRMKGIVRTESEFREGFLRARVSKAHLARYYLRAIEMVKTGEKNPELGGILEDTATYNLEYVIPLRPSQNWSLSEEIMQAYAKRIGNMTLLDPTQNSCAGSDTFEEKLPLYKNSPVLITQDLGRYTKWDVDEIDDRQASLAELALKVWVT